MTLNLSTCSTLTLNPPQHQTHYPQRANQKLSQYSCLILIPDPYSDPFLAPISFLLNPGVVTLFF